MKKTALWISTITLGLFLCVPNLAYAEVIKNYSSGITVQIDGSVAVIETITYDSEGLSRHGIFRDITPKSSQGKVMDIKNISITDQDGMSIPWQRESNNGDVRLRIGDPNSMFVGVKTYVIGYTATNAVAHLGNGTDEIYWNATGNHWPFPIEKFTAQVSLPNSIHETQNACYTGVVGSMEQGCSAVSGGFASSRVLGPGEGATVAVGFASGFIHSPSITIREKVINFLKLFWPLLIPLLTFIFMFRKWYKKGRDPKDASVIIPQYDVPEGLTPMEVGIIVYQKSQTVDISAELIYLATKGYIKIHQTEGKALGFIDTTSYELTYLKDKNTLSNEFDKELLSKIFGDSTVGQAVELRSLRNTFYKHIPSLITLVQESVLNKQYYSYLPSVESSRSSVFLIIPFFYLLFIIGSAFSSSILVSLGGNPVAILFLVFSIIVSAIIFTIFQKIMPAKTQKGVAIKDYILGLKQYLQIAEKDRINFHNAPEKKPEVFEQLLPYAMVLGVEHAWAKEFKDIYTTPPSWYETSSSGGFNTLLFTNNLSTFSTFTTSSLTSSPHHSSGGSGGGGFSGGGGGGGGGGSW